MSTDSQPPEAHQQRPSNSVFRPPLWDDDSRLVATGRQPWLSALACLLFVAALTFVAGLLGTVAGIATVGVWYLLGTPYAVAAGTLLATATAPQPVEPLAVVLVATPLLVLVLAPVVATPHGTTAIVVALVTTGALAGSGWLLLQSLPLWLVALTLLSLLAITVYSQHRYLLLRLGLLDDTREHSETSHDAPSQHTNT